MSEAICSRVYRATILRTGVYSIFLVFATANAHPQSSNPEPNAATENDQVASSANNPNAPRASAPPYSYSYPDGKQQFQNYLNAVFGPLAFVRTAISAGLDQSKPAPPEWDSGVAGYGERYGFQFGILMISETVKYSGGAVLHEDVEYHKCECVGLFPRTKHAIVSVFTAKTKNDRTVLSPPSIIAPYAASFTAMNVWYPARYGPADAFRTGSVSFGFRMGVNVVREFFLRSR